MLCWVRLELCAIVHSIVFNVEASVRELIDKGKFGTILIKDELLGRLASVVRNRQVLLVVNSPSFSRNLSINDLVLDPVYRRKGNWNLLSCLRVKSLVLVWVLLILDLLVNRNDQKGLIFKVVGSPLV